MSIKAMATFQSQPEITQEGRAYQFFTNALHTEKEVDLAIYIPQGFEFKPIQYQHYKGGLYTFFFTAEFIEDKESVVVYQNSEGRFFARPETMFFESVEVKGKRIPRFRKSWEEYNDKRIDSTV